MKIIRNNMIYVQGSDLKFLHSYSKDIPGLENVAENGVDDLEFIQFEDENVVHFLMSEEWILDYDQIMGKSEAEIARLGQEVVDEKNMLVAKFNNMSSRDKRSHLDLMLKAKLLDYRINALINALWIKQGKLKVNLPDGTRAEEKKENGISRLKRIFSK